MSSIFKITTCLVVSIIVVLINTSAFAVDGNIVDDNKIDLKDFASLSSNWLASDCAAPLWCDGCDIDHSGDVGLSDLAILGEGWLNYFATMDISWIPVEDSGDGMTDLNGNPIYIDVFIADIGQYEITNAQYSQFLNAALETHDIVVDGNYIRGANGLNNGRDYQGKIYFDLTRDNEYKCSQIVFSDGRFSPLVVSGKSMADYPVIEVSWYGAMAFCSYYGYSLPTEWQWQAAADFDGSSVYGCGLSIDHSIANYDYNQNPILSTSYPYTTPVSSFELYGNLAGNVWEWTSSELGVTKIIKGGSSSSPKGFCRTAIRCCYFPETTSMEVGFRVCR